MRIRGSGDTRSALRKFVFYRFANRYRMAVQFRGLTLEGFPGKTEAGYSALTRAFLAWLVFERYADLAGDPPPYGRLLSLVPMSKAPSFSAFQPFSLSAFQLFP